MVWLTILFIVATAAAHYLAGVEKKKHKADKTVFDRRWETTIGYDNQQFIEWVGNPNSAVAGYAAVLAPYDFALLLCLGASLACASFAAAGALNLSSPATAGLALLPLAFIAADATEDRRLLKLFAARAAAPADVEKLKAITKTKFVALALAGLQTAGLVIWALVAA